MSTFQPGVPSGTVKLNIDYRNIQQNFQQLDTTFGVDHTTFSNQTAQNGYHKTVHMIPISTIASRPPNNQPINPGDYTAVPGYGQLLDAQINDNINIDTALYFLTGGNILQQLTRNFLPVTANTGCTFLPGGLILQWGTVIGTHGGGNHTFNIGDTGTVTFAAAAPANFAFPNAIFSAWTQIFYDSTTAGVPGTTSTITAAIDFSTFAKTGFNWRVSGAGSSFTQFNWFALGN
jgi:hypothetical protein